MIVRGYGDYYVLMERSVNLAQKYKIADKTSYVIITVGGSGSDLIIY